MVGQQLGLPTQFALQSIYFMKSVFVGWKHSRNPAVTSNLWPIFGRKNWIISNEIIMIKKKKNQNLGHSRKFIIAKNVIKDRLRKLILAKNFQRDHSRKFIPNISQFFSLAKVSFFKVGRRGVCYNRNAPRIHWKAIYELLHAINEYHGRFGSSNEGL